MFVSRCQRVPRARLLGEALELGAGIAVVGIFGEGSAQSFERLAIVFAASLPELRVLTQDGDAIVLVAGQLEALPVERNQVAPIIGGLVEGP